VALKALEKNQFSKLPSYPYLKGFVQNYAKALKLDPAKTVAVFKRDYTRRHQKDFLPRGVTKPLSKSSQLNPAHKNIILFFTSLIILAVLISISVIRLYQPPKLTIFQPQTGQEVTSPVLIKGKTNHDANLTLNQKTINLEPDGSFTTVFKGPVGTSKLVFKSTSRRHKTTEIIHHIIIIN